MVLQVGCRNVKVGKVAIGKALGRSWSWSVASKKMTSALKKPPIEAADGASHLILSDETLEGWTVA